MGVLFENDGEIDVRAITTFGVSVKDSTTAIGYFGTGIKYAIAILLRQGHTITIYSGENKYCFSTKVENIRGKDFDIIHMNDQPLGFTTEQGKTWQMWMAVREIVCNCTDEKGSHKVYDGEVIGEVGKTKILVEGSEFESEYLNRSSFLIEGKPKYEIGNLQVFEGVTNSFFYKGVRVHEAEKPFKYTYNILSGITLTEDRTMRYSNYDLNHTFAASLMKVEDDEIISSLVHCGKEFEEYGLGYHGTPSRQLAEAVSQYEGVVMDKLPPSLKAKCSPSLFTVLEKTSQCELNKVQQMQLELAIDFLKDIGFNVSEYPVKVMQDLGSSVLGLADQKSRKIYLSRNVFDLGTKYVAGTLYEEWIHIHHNVEDETRAFQDVVINHLMGVGEQLTGRPI